MKSRKDTLLFTRIIQNIIVGADVGIGPYGASLNNNSAQKKRKIMLDI